MVGNYIELNKVLYISPGFPANGDDSTCIPALQDFFKELKRNEVVSDVVSLHYPAEANYTWHGHNVEAMGWDNPGKFKKVSLLKKAIKTITKKAQANEIKLIHSFWMTDASYIASKAAAKLRLPHVVTVMGQDVQKSPYTDQIVSEKAHLVSLSSFQQQLVSSNLGPSRVIPWGINPDEFRSKEEKTIDLITVGSLIDLKQSFQTVELVANLIEDFPGIKAVIVGDGPNKSKLADLISEKRLTNQVTLTGELSRSDTMALMAKSKILFHPSSYEGFGMTLIEGLAAGASVVSYKTGVAMDLDQINSVQNLKEAEIKIRDLLGGMKVELSFPMTINSTVEHYLKLYQEVLT